MLLWLPVDVKNCKDGFVPARPCQILLRLCGVLVSNETVSGSNAFRATHEGHNFGEYGKNMNAFFTCQMMFVVLPGVR